MRFSVWSEDEQRKLDGLPWMQRCLYMILRWHMDIKSCRVGLVRGISYKSLSEELYVDPAPGRRESGAPTEKAVRHALEQLAKVGLIKSVGGDTHLVFELTVARGLAREKSKGQERGRVFGQGYQQPESLDMSGFERDWEAEMGHPENSPKGHTSEVKVNPLSVETTSSSDGAVDNFSDRMMMRLTAEQAVDLVAWLERKRGKSSPLVVTDPVVLAWSAESVTGLELSEAHRLAVANRKANKCESPVNSRFLDSILRTQVLNRRVVCSEVKLADPATDWFGSEDGVARMAERVGVARLGGEAWTAWRLRVNSEIDQRERDRKAEQMRLAKEG